MWPRLRQAGLLQDVRARRPGSRWVPRASSTWTTSGCSLVPRSRLRRLRDGGGALMRLRQVRYRHAQLADAVRDARGLALRLELLRPSCASSSSSSGTRASSRRSRGSSRSVQRDRAAAGVPLAATRTNLFGVERAQRPLEVAGRLAGQRLSVQLVAVLAVRDRALGRHEALLGT